MKTSTRLLCLMLALLLCLCVFFVACNNEPDPEPTPTPDDGGSGGTVTPEPEEPADPTDQKKGELHPTGYTGEGAQIQEPNQEVSGDETLRS
ncbi:MAG: hypothetical protein IKD28_05895 [Clostridia bacterium]|nr:hypothetical protein [Clostridia bacterium]